MDARIKKNFGFGLMRLPMIGESVDIEQTKDMVDAFIDAGFNYFDTAHPYIGGKSEEAVRECLTSRYSRDDYILTNKLTGSCYKNHEEIRPLFESQLKTCGVNYFDYCLLHAQDRNKYKKCKETKAYEEVVRMRDEGKIHHIGISFHDTSDILDMILSERSEIEVVQLQFNYLDMNDEKVQSRKNYEVCQKHGKDVIVMEPVKGGKLIALPKEADAILRNLGGGSNAEYALRFAASFPGVKMILSGMSTFSQLQENIKIMRDVKPLTQEELKAIDEVVKIYKSKNWIPCTACRYCIEENECPKGILIPDIFSACNNGAVDASTASMASACIKCGRCEKVCPQHLDIRELLHGIA